MSVYFPASSALPAPSSFAFSFSGCAAEYFSLLPEYDGCISAGFDFKGMVNRSRFRYSESSGVLMTTEPEPSADFVNLYRRAFAEYGPRALWNMRPIDDPTPSDALAITKALRTYGGMEGRRLAENIERLCRAAH